MNHPRIEVTNNFCQHLHMKFSKAVCRLRPDAPLSPIMRSLMRKSYELDD